MTTKIKGKHPLTEDEIDEIVERQADDESAWDAPVRVKRKKQMPLAIPDSLAARAAFIANLHRQSDVEKWLTSIILERIEYEESAFAGIKRNMGRRLHGRHATSPLH